MFVGLRGSDGETISTTTNLTCVALLRALRVGTTAFQLLVDSQLHKIHVHGFLVFSKPRGYRHDAGRPESRVIQDAPLGLGIDFHTRGGGSEILSEHSRLAACRYTETSILARSNLAIYDTSVSCAHHTVSPYCVP